MALLPENPVWRYNLACTLALQKRPTVAIEALSRAIAASGALILNANPGVTNIVKVQVTAPDGLTMQTYMVNVRQLPSQNPPALTNRVSGTNLTLTWPLANLGYSLLVQTNNLVSGISSDTNDWMPVPNSTLTNQISLPFNPLSPSEYYRLVSP